MIGSLAFLLLVHFTCSSEVKELSQNITTAFLSAPEYHDNLKNIQGNILCRSCGNKVASSYDLIPKSIPYSLYFFRDSLFDKDEVLIQVLPGDFIDIPVVTARISACVGVGEWEEYDDDSGFPGYQSKACACPDCGEYIGWIFEPVNPDIAKTTFYVLTLTVLVGETFTDSLLVVPEESFN